MIGKRIFLVLAAGAVLLLQFADCITPLSTDQQTMQCCGSMPCTPANHSHDCCKTMVFRPLLGVQPPASASFQPPVLVVIERPPALEFARLLQSLPIPVQAKQHAPPQELYTLHLSLLI